MENGKWLEHENTTIVNLSSMLSQFSTKTKFIKKKKDLCDIKLPVLACIKIYYFFSIRNYFLMNIHKRYAV